MIMLTPDNELEAFAHKGMLFVLNLTKKLILHIPCTEPVPFVLSTVKSSKMLGRFLWCKMDLATKLGIGS